MEREVSIVRPDCLMESHFLKDIYSVVRKTDEENWAYFAKENEQEFALDFLNYGDLTRLIYVDNQPVAYINCYLLKSNAHNLLKDDYYHTMGLSLSDLRIIYEGRNKSYRRNSLYINVVAITKDHQGSVEILKAIAKALYDIIKHDLFYTTSYSENKYLYPKQIYAVAVTNEGERMCDFFDFNLEGSSARLIDTTETERKLYKGNVDLLINKLFKISKKK